jgi:exopolysaccharide biosynthesis polyprenyl glycosylphosphotransferase
MFARSKITHLWLFHFLADFAAIAAAYYSVLLFRFHSIAGAAFFNTLNQLFGVGTSGIHVDAYQVFYIVSAPRIISYLTIVICALYALRDLYPERRFIRKRPVAWDIIAANVIALAIFYTYFYLRRNIFHPRSFLATFVVFNILFCIGFRGLIDRLLDLMRTSFGIDRHRVILVGASEDADFIKRYIEETHPNGLHLVAQLGLDPTKDISTFIAALEQKAAQERANMMILAEKGLSVPQIMQLLELGERTNMAVKVLSDKMNVLVSHAKVPVDMIRGCPLVHFEVPILNRKPSIGRRLMTLALAGIALLVTLPLTLAIAILIKLTSRGPVFFVQERIGVNRKPFRMLKFRTMYDRADELLAQVEEFNESGKGLFKIRNDKRITPVGRLLRKFSLDELPQLINVLRGEMAIVGPRPLPRRDFENYYEEWHYTRHNGIPGLTCLWQVSGRSDLNFHDMCILDVFYLTNRNWVLDLKIALRTFWAVLFGKGAY